MNIRAIDIWFEKRRNRWLTYVNSLSEDAFTYTHSSREEAIEWLEKHGVARADILKCLLLNTEIDI